MPSKNTHLIFSQGKGNIDVLIEDRLLLIKCTSNTKLYTNIFSQSNMLQQKGKKMAKYFIQMNNLILKTQLEFLSFR